MVRFKRQKITKDAAGFKHGFRSGLEDKFIKELEQYGIKPMYESREFKYTVPETVHKYTPDFPVSPHIIIETKGRFDVDDRKKMLLVKEQYPDIEFRMVFYNANQRIKKGSKTTYAMWCDKNGFKWAHKTLPREWLDDIFNDLANS